MRTFPVRSVVLLSALATALGGCNAPESFRGNPGTGGAGTGGTSPAGTGGHDPGTGGTTPGTGGMIQPTGSGGTGTGGAGTGGTGTGGTGSGGTTVDAPVDTVVPDAPVDKTDAVDARDAPVDTGGPLTYENHCLRSRWKATASPLPDMAIGAIDGDPGSWWWTMAGQVGNESIDIDMGDLVKVNQIVLDDSGGHQTDYPRGYQILASSDGKTFTTTVMSGNPGAASVVTLNFPVLTTRALRIKQTVNDPTNWWTIHELRLGCQPATPPPAGAFDPLDPGHWKLTASSNLGGYATGNVIDGDLATRWSTAAQQAGNEWFLVDMGAATSISEVSLVTRTNPNDFPAQYNLELSTDNQTFKSVATGAGQLVTKIDFPATAAQYIRIRQTGSTPMYWWSIEELAIRP